MPHVVFVHGLSNKPPAEDLHRLWRRALAKDNGIDLVNEGVPSTMVYWADVFYDKPDSASSTALESEELLATNAQQNALNKASLIVPPRASVDEVDFINQLAQRFDVKVSLDDVGKEGNISSNKATLVHEAIPLPGFLKERIMASFVREAHAYLFDKESAPRTGITYHVQAELRSRFINTLKSVREESPKEPIVVVSHSMGTMIAYDCLMRVPDCPSISMLMTIGSPLGIDEIQEKLKPEWSRSNGFPSEKISEKWINVFDPLDAVSRLDPRLANDYQHLGLPKIEEIEEKNWGAWRHNIVNYLQGKQLRNALSEALAV